MIKSLSELEKSNLSEDAKRQIRKAFNAKNNRTSHSASNLELSPRCKSMEAKASKRFTSPVRIDIYSTRERKTDIDNISGKAVLDGIVKSGILRDDSPDEIEAYQVHKATIGNEEKTIIVITEL